MTFIIIISNIEKKKIKKKAGGWFLGSHALIVGYTGVFWGEFT